MTHAAARFACALMVASLVPLGAQEGVSDAELQALEERYYTTDYLTTPEGEVLEVCGLDQRSDGALLASTRRGRVWLIHNALGEDPGAARFSIFAEGLQEGLGLNVVRAADGSERVYVVQRGELTELIDHDGDDRADEHRVVCADWGLSPNYHEFAFGLPQDDLGNLYVSLNVGFLDPEWWHGRSVEPWRGWLLRIDPRTGVSTPVACGLRSPAGLGRDAHGNILVTDNQGDWMAVCPVFVIEEGTFLGHPAGLDWTALYHANGAHSSTTIPASVARAPAAAWLPYKWSRSAGSLELDGSGGRFGPFAGQQFIAELTNGHVLRMDLEQVRGVWQGAVWPFRQRVGSACRVLFADDGTLVLGLTNRGWGGLAPGHGLARLRWTGVVPMEMSAVRLVEQGFAISFTRPLARSVQVADVSLVQYDYDWWWEYGSPERRQRDVLIDRVEVAPDRRSMLVVTSDLRAGMMARLRLSGVEGSDGHPLLHPEVAYTINQLPSGPLCLEHVVKRAEPPPAKGSEHEGWLRLSYGDALDAWDATGWYLVDAELDPEDRSTFQTKPGVNALVNVGAAPASDLVSRYAMGSGTYHVEYLLPEGGATELRIHDAYALLIEDTTTDPTRPPTGTIPAPVGGGEARCPARDLHRGPGQWHVLELDFVAPRLDAGGRRVRPARFAAVRLDETVLHEDVVFRDGPNVEGTADERALGPLVIGGTSTPLALRTLMFKPAPPEADSGWVPVFDGRSLDGWTALSPAGSEVEWEVEDGVLYGSEGRGVLLSPQEASGNMAVRARLRVSDHGDAGLLTRAPRAIPASAGPVAGYEVQALPSGADARKTGSLLGFADVHVELVQPGTWFTLELTAVDGPDGTQLTAAVNGVVVAEAVDIERRWTGGHVGISLEHEDTELELASLEVRRLP